MPNPIYLDNAATTPVSQLALEALLPFYKEEYGNPSSVYSTGRRAHQALDEARAKVAKALGATPEEIYFTSCGTESDNWAIKGAAHRLLPKGKTHLITTVFELHAVLHSMQQLEKEGFSVTYLPVDENGLLTAADVEAAITDKTALVSIMYANNEIGTILPIPEIGAVCKKHGVWFHTDAVQAVGNVPIDVVAQNIDLLSLSGHKLRAPKGVGALYVRKGVVLDTFMHGGAQERSRRAGTENVAGIAALGAAIEYAVDHMAERTAHERALRDRVMDALLSAIPRSRLNGDRHQRLAGNLNLSFEGVEGESLLLMLDMNGIAASSGSACTSGSLDPSHVLMAIGLPHELAHGSLRLSFGDVNTDADADAVIAVLPGIVERLRSMSPLWEKILREEKEGK